MMSIQARAQHRFHCPTRGLTWRLLIPTLVFSTSSLNMTTKHSGLGRAPGYPFRLVGQATSWPQQTDLASAFLEKTPTVPSCRQLSRLFILVIFPEMVLLSPLSPDIPVP